LGSFPNLSHLLCRVSQQSSTTCQRVLTRVVIFALFT
jgi:hypothetical protein